VVRVCKLHYGGSSFSEGARSSGGGGL